MASVITGKRVILRSKRLEDAWDDYAWKCDPDLAKLDATSPLSIPFSIYYTSYSQDLRYEGDMDHRYAIDSLEGKHIGNCSCYNIDHMRGEAELGILIGDPDYWDKGYGSDAVITLVNHVFQERHMNRIYLHTLEDNLRAQRCFEKCGFVALRQVTKGMHRFILMEVEKSIASPAASSR
ncbi:GNAT family N-acetyltransferase [Chloroflexota bacterium]